MEYIIRFLNDIWAWFLGSLIRALEKFFQMFELYEALALCVLRETLESCMITYFFIQSSICRTEEHSATIQSPELSSQATNTSTDAQIGCPARTQDVKKLFVPLKITFWALVSHWLAA